MPGDRTTARVTDAVILMAGIGSRLRPSSKDLPKPLIQIAGKAVFSYTMDALEGGGIKTIHVVTGYNSDLLLAGLQPLIPEGMELHPIHNAEWKKQNGISAFAAKPYLQSPFLLTMGDHLFGPSIVDRAIRDSDLSVLNVAVDRKVDGIFDLDDAMKVQIRGDRVIAIGKDLKDYDAIDTGLFVCPPVFFDYLEEAKHGGDCSLAEGVRAMAAEGKVRAVDIGDGWWQDIDTPEMLAVAERVLTGSGGRFTPGPALP